MSTQLTCVAPQACTGCHLQLPQLSLLSCQKHGGRFTEYYCNNPVMVYIIRLLHSLLQVFSKVVYLVNAGCPALLSQSHRSRQLAVKAYADGATECAASVAGAVQSICVARGSIPSTQLQVSLHALNQCTAIFSMLLVLLAAWPAYVNDCSAFASTLSAFGCAVCTYASACKLCMRPSQWPKSRQ